MCVWRFPCWVALYSHCGHWNFWPSSCTDFMCFWSLSSIVNNNKWLQFTKSLYVILWINNQYQNVKWNCEGLFSALLHYISTVSAARRCGATCARCSGPGPASGGWCSSCRRTSCPPPSSGSSPSSSDHSHSNHSIMQYYSDPSFIYRYKLSILHR